MKLVTIGYSARTISNDIDWDQERRRVFLLNSEVKIPKSVDPNVWEEPLKEYTNSIPSLPLPYWHDLDELDHAVSKLTYSCEIISISICGDVEIPEHMNFFRPRPFVFPRKRFSSFIGYDVADSALISGLFNCGFDDLEKTLAANDFSSFLNEFGLFNSIEKAEKFRSYSDKRVREHAPFYVYAIFSEPNLET